MKNINLSDYFFSFRMVFLLFRHNYKKAIINCDRRINKIGDNYGSHYVKMHAEFYSGNYLNSYVSYKYLLGKKYLSKSVINWGIQLFIETQIVRNKDYKTAEERINELLNTDAINQDQKEKLNKILVYIKQMDGVSISN